MSKKLSLGTDPRTCRGEREWERRHRLGNDHLNCVLLCWNRRSCCFFLLLLLCRFWPFSYFFSRDEDHEEQRRLFSSSCSSFFSPFFLRLENKDDPLIISFSIVLCCLYFSFFRSFSVVLKVGRNTRRMREIFASVMRTISRIKASNKNKISLFLLLSFLQLVHSFFVCVCAFMTNNCNRNSKKDVSLFIKGSFEESVLCCKDRKPKTHTHTRTLL